MNGLSGLVHGTNVVVTLMVTHLIASMVAVELRNLRLSVVALAVQSALLAGIFASFAYLLPEASHLWGWVIVAVVTKVIIIPVLLWVYTNRLPEREVLPVIGFRLSLVIVLVMTIVFYRLMHTYIEFIAPTRAALDEPARSSLAIAFTVFALGLYVLVARRDAVKIIIGLVLMENGVHLSLVTLAPSLRETTLLGVATNVIITAWLLLYLTGAIYRVLGTTDTATLSTLKR
jgi:hydrogenase-4 component E